MPQLRTATSLPLTTRRAAPRKSPNWIYLFSVCSSPALTEQPQHGEPVCKDSPAHVIFLAPEGKGSVCLPRWMEPSEPGVSTFLIALLCVNLIPAKESFRSPSQFNFFYPHMLTEKQINTFSTTNFLSSCTCLHFLFLKNLIKGAGGCWSGDLAPRWHQWADNLLRIVC